jgi:hypothetical protein
LKKVFVHVYKNKILWFRFQRIHLFLSNFPSFH